MTDSQYTTEKKIYIKPEITEIRLVAREAVLGMCKDGEGLDTSCLGSGTCAVTGSSI